MIFNKLFTCPTTLSFWVHRKLKDIEVLLMHRAFKQSPGTVGFDLILVIGIENATVSVFHLYFGNLQMHSWLICVWLTSLLQWHWLQIVAQFCLLLAKAFTYPTFFVFWPCFIHLVQCFSLLYYRVIVDIFMFHSFSIPFTTELCASWRQEPCLIDYCITYVEGRAQNQRGHWINILLMELKSSFLVLDISSNKISFQVIFIVRLVFLTVKQRIVWDLGGRDVQATQPIKRRKVGIIVSPVELSLVGTYYLQLTGPYSQGAPYTYNMKNKVSALKGLVF